MSNRLYVGNLSFQTDDASLTEAFGGDGRQVVSAQVMVDRDTGRSRGFGFVEMATPADAQAAIEAWNGKELDGRALRVNIAEPRAPRQGGGGGGGRGGFGGGGGGGGRGRGGYGGGGGGGYGGGGGGRGGGGRDRGGRDRDSDDGDRW